MTTPTQAQPFQGGAYPGQSGQGGPPPPQPYQQNERNQSAVVQYAGPAGAQQPFEKYVVMHVATTCDEHGVYVTKDSAEVIELGWTVVDARDPSLPEVRHCVNLLLDCTKSYRFSVLTTPTGLC